MDGILEGNTKDGIFQKVLKNQLLSKIADSGNWSNLAVDRVGQHTVKKLFDRLVSYNDKARLVAELAQAKAKLSGNNMGRSVLESCAVHEFLEGEATWKAKLESIEKEKKALSEILIMTGQGNQDGGKKRKRKRKGTRDVSENASANEDSTETSRKTTAKDEIVKKSVNDVLELLESNAPKGKRRKRRKKKRDE